MAFNSPSMGGASDSKRSRNKKLSDKELAESRRLRDLWLHAKRERKLTQEWLAERMGFSTQGAVSHYMSGRARLSNEVLLKFAYHLQFDPIEVRPEIYREIPQLAPQADSEAKLRRVWAQLGEDERAMLLALAEKIASRKGFLQTPKLALSIANFTDSVIFAF